MIVNVGVDRMYSYKWHFNYDITIVTRTFRTLNIVLINTSINFVPVVFALGNPRWLWLPPPYPPPLPKHCWLSEVQHISDIVSDIVYSLCRQDERLFVCLTMESLWVVDRDVSTATRLMKTSSIAVETSRSTTQSDSMVRQTNKRSSCLTYTTMNKKHIFNDTVSVLHHCRFRGCGERSL